MTALSIAILIFSTTMILIALAINYLRNRHEKARTDSFNDPTFSEKGKPDDNNVIRRANNNGVGSPNKRSATVSARAHTKTAATKPAYVRKYRAVEVRPQLNSCRAVLALEGRRFLAEEAPNFPLPDCRVKTCRCQYVYYADRRDEERRSTLGMARNWAPVIGGDRRHGDRRRVTTART